MAAATAWVIGGNGSSSSWMLSKDRQKKQKRVNGVKILCASSSMMDPYKTLRIRHGASESEVKKAYRKLALQYHPDVCKGTNCGVKFHQITEAYDVVMANLRGESNATKMYETHDSGIDEPTTGMDYPDGELWEEWMGWEGAGIRDYSSHINPYI